MPKIFAALVAASAIALVGAGSGSVFAASSPAAGEPPMVAWVWSPPAAQGGSDGITFDYGGNMVGFPFPTVSSGTSANWGGLDNPAPLLWYATHVDHNNPRQMSNDLGQMFATGVQYSASLIQKMNDEHFAPSMVGGINPSGITTDTTPSSPSPAGSTSPVSTTPPVSSSPPSTQSSAPVSSTTPVITTRVTSVAPHSAPVTSAAATTSHTVSPAVHPQTSTTVKAVVSTQTTSPSASPVAPSSQAGVAYPHYRQHLVAEAANGQHNHVPVGTGPWPWAVGAAVLVGGGAYGLWRWRQTH